MEPYNEPYEEPYYEEPEEEYEEAQVEAKREVHEEREEDFEEGKNTMKGKKVMMKERKSGEETYEREASKFKRRFMKALVGWDFFLVLIVAQFYFQGY